MKIITLTVLLLVSTVTSPRAQGGFNYDDLATVLPRVVSGSGLVDYAAIKKNPYNLEDYIARMKKLRTSVLYDHMTPNEQMAFWINSYNAVVMNVVVQNYPIKGTKTDFPANSIRQIPGVFDKQKHAVASHSHSLNQIENDILRKDFDEPRIHFALVCGAVSCPPLRDEPYLGNFLDDQLADQTKRFLSRSENFRIDRDASVVHLSSIFEWFAGDFDADVSIAIALPVDAKYQGVIKFIMGYVSDDDRTYLMSQKYTLAFVPYDWSLNDHALAPANKGSK